MIRGWLYHKSHRIPSVRFRLRRYYFSLHPTTCWMRWDDKVIIFRTPIQPYLFSERCAMHAKENYWRFLKFRWEYRTKEDR